MVSNNLSISSLYDAGKITHHLFNALDRKNIFSLKQLEKIRFYDIKQWERIGPGAITKLKSLMKQNK